MKIQDSIIYPSPTLCLKKVVLLVLFCGIFQHSLHQAYLHVASIALHNDTTPKWYISRGVKPFMVIDDKGGEILDKDMKFPLDDKGGDDL
jgi:hypothetical protein